MKAANETTIVLCGGSINFSNMPVGSNVSNAMIPVNGKPVIGWILDDLLTKGIRLAVIVLRDNNHHLADFIERVYAARMEIIFARLTEEGTIVQSLQAGLMANPVRGIVRVILGDTLIRDSFESEQNFAYVGEVKESRRWCLATIDRNGQIINYLDKQDVHQGPFYALSGYYQFLRGDILRQCVDSAATDDAREISHVLELYAQFQPIFAKQAKEWFDFGNIDNLVSARQRLLQPRYFNMLTINPVLGTITKISQNNEKLRDELEWYFTIPDDLKVLTPRIISHHKKNGQVQIVQEYYGYPTLAELYVYGELHFDAWVSIIRRVLAIHCEFRKHEGTLETDSIANMYQGKTFDRLQQLSRDETWQVLLDSEYIIFNGKKLRGWKLIKNDVQSNIEGLSKTAPVSVVHGDYCFSNILYDLGNQIIRLIDPRGSFGARGIYGDSRYDIAKLRHSVCEGYDYIVADMFDLFDDGGQSYEARIYHNGLPHILGEFFDKSITEMGYSLEDVRFIEGLLFLSMIPLHADYRQRQKLMMLTGLSLLNEVF